MHTSSQYKYLTNVTFSLTKKKPFLPRNLWCSFLLACNKAFRVLPPEIAQFSPVYALLSQLSVLPHSPWGPRLGHPVVSTSADSRWGTWPALLFPETQDTTLSNSAVHLPTAPLTTSAPNWAHNISRHWGLCPNSTMPPAAFTIRHYSCRPCAFSSPWVYFFLLHTKETCLCKRLAGTAAAYENLPSAPQGRKADLGCFVLFWNSSVLAQKRTEKKKQKKSNWDLERSSLEVYGNFSSTKVQNYKPRDKTRQKQR